MSAEKANFSCTEMKVYKFCSSIWNPGFVQNCVKCSEGSCKKCCQNKEEVEQWRSSLWSIDMGWLHRSCWQGVPLPLAILPVISPVIYISAVILSFIIPIKAAAFNRTVGRVTLARIALLACIIIDRVFPALIVINTIMRCKSVGVGLTSRVWVW